MLPTLLQIMLSAHAYKQPAEKTVQGFHEIIRLSRRLTPRLIHFGTVAKPSLLEHLEVRNKALIFNIIKWNIKRIIFSY